VKEGRLDGILTTHSFGLPDPTRREEGGVKKERESRGPKGEAEDDTRNW